MLFCNRKEITKKLLIKTEKKNTFLHMKKWFICSIRNISFFFNLKFKKKLFNRTKHIDNCNLLKNLFDNFINRICSTVFSSKKPIILNLSHKFSLQSQLSDLSVYFFVLRNKTIANCLIIFAILSEQLLFFFFFSEV